MPLSLSLSRSLRLLVRLVYRPTLVTTTSTAFSPKAVFGCCVKRLTKVQVVSFIVDRNRTACAHSPIIASPSCRFSSSNLFVVEEITRKIHIVLLSRTIFCALQLFFSRRKSGEINFTFPREPVCSFDAKTETGFSEALISRNVVNDPRLAWGKGRPKIYLPVGIRQHWLAEFRELVLKVGAVDSAVSSSRLRGIARKSILAGVAFL